MTVKHAKPLSLIKTVVFYSTATKIHLHSLFEKLGVKRAYKRKILCKMVGSNKSVQACRSRETVELKVSPITTFVGVINPFLPPVLPLRLQVIPVSSAGASICPIPPSVYLVARSFWLPFSSSRPPAPDTPVAVPVTSVSLGARKHVATIWYVCTGIWGWTLQCLERGTSGGGKGYSIRIPPEPEPSAEFLPLDKSWQQVSVKQEGQGTFQEWGG